MILEYVNSYNNYISHKTSKLISARIIKKEIVIQYFNFVLKCLHYRSSNQLFVVCETITFDIGGQAVTFFRALIS